MSENFPEIDSIRMLLSFQTPSPHVLPMLMEIILWFIRNCNVLVSFISLKKTNCVLLAKFFRKLRIQALNRDTNSFGTNVVYLASVFKHSGTNRIENCFWYKCNHITNGRYNACKRILENCCIIIKVRDKSVRNGTILILVSSYSLWTSLSPVVYMNFSRVSSKSDIGARVAFFTWKCKWFWHLCRLNNVNVLYSI